MKRGKYCVAIMSVGSGIGQSVISSCNLSNFPIHTVESDINPFAFGSYECDEFEIIPKVTSADYLTELLGKLVKKVLNTETIQIIGI